MEIFSADTDADRLNVRDFLARHIPDIASDALPALRNDLHYTPIIPVVREEGEIVAAALTCRAQLSAGASMLAGAPGRLPHVAEPYLRLRDRHAELDLLAVAETHRKQGIATSLIEFMESELRARSVRVWFGNVTKDLDVERLANFYRRRGFTVTGEGETLPPLLGVPWVHPAAEPAAFYFCKQLVRPVPDPEPT